MLDRFGRSINCLRISVTDRCDFRCIYCMPEEGVEPLKKEEVLSLEEIAQVAQCGVGLGLNRLRLTGGEPLVKKGILDLLVMLKRIDGIEEIAMTTNGNLLSDFAQDLKGCGLKRLNISLDSLNPEKFTRITRGGDLSRVLKGIEKAMEVGFEHLKINFVVMGGINDEEIEAFALYALEHPIEVRFIERMPTNFGLVEGSRPFVSIKEVMTKIQRLGPLTPFPTGNNQAGPAKLFKLPRAKGALGFISSVSEPFCSQCNRLRLTASGKLLTCLFGESQIDLILILRNQNSQEALKEAFIQAVAQKPFFRPGKCYGPMSQIGG